MTNQQTQERYQQGDAGVTDVFSSMMSLATACTRFTFHQMTNMMNMFTAPRSVMKNVKCTLDNISNAMNQPADQPTEESSRHHSSHQASHPAEESTSERRKRSFSEPQQAEDALSGRKV